MTAVAASIYYAAIDIDTEIDRAWDLLVDYEAWNPSFAHAIVTTRTGERGAEGEVVHIDERDAAGTRVSEFYAETTRIVPGRRIAWFVYPLDGEEFRNFIDFELVPREGGVTFEIRYYAQVRGVPDTDDQRPGDRVYADLALAFKEHCDAKAPASPV
jgi:hypothetical protein